MRVAPDGAVVGQSSRRAGRKAEKLREVARCQRQLRHRARINYAAKLWTFRLQERSGCNRDRVCGQSGDSERGIARRRLCNTDANIGEDFRRKPVSRDAEAILTGRQERNGIATRIVTGDLSRFARCLAGGDHFRADDERTILIFNSAGDAPVRLRLREGGRRQQ